MKEILGLLLAFSVCSNVWLWVNLWNLKKEHLRLEERMNSLLKEKLEKRIKDKFRKVVKELRRTLNAYGIERVLHRVNQESRIRTEHVECDLYDYLEDEE